MERAGWAATDELHGPGDGVDEQGGFVVLLRSRLTIKSHQISLNVSYLNLGAAIIEGLFDISKHHRGVV